MATDYKGLTCTNSALKRSLPGHLDHARMPTCTGGVAGHRTVGDDGDLTRRDLPPPLQAVRQPAT